MPLRGEKRQDHKVKPVSKHLREKEEKLQQILARLAEEASNGTPIIVEGKKDTETLDTLCIRGKIVSAKSGGKSLLDVVSEVRNSGVREVVLLLDFDRRGKELTVRLRQLLEHEGAKPSTILWTEIFGLVGKEVKDVEGLASYMETLKRKLSGNSQT